MDQPDPVVSELQAALLRAMTAQRKLELADELLGVAWELKLSNLRQRFPGMTEAELNRRVADLFANVPG